MPQVALTIDLEQDAPPSLGTWRGMESGLLLSCQMGSNSSGPESGPRGIRTRSAHAGLIHR